MCIGSYIFGSIARCQVIDIGDLATQFVKVPNGRLVACSEFCQVGLFRALWWSWQRRDGIHGDEYASERTL